jgi:hypothetical protein
MFRRVGEPQNRCYPEENKKKSLSCSALFLVTLLTALHMEAFNNQFCLGFMGYIVANDIRRHKGRCGTGIWLKKHI